MSPRIPNALAQGDIDRLLQACGRSQVDPSVSLFTLDGPVQTVNREAVLLAGGGRALLMQVAHPLVAAGVAHHSNFETEPLTRLWRTLDLTLTIIFADAASALGAVKTIERRHAPVHGEIAAPAARFPAGSTYDANAPDLLLWVHATLIDSAMVTFERFVRPFAANEKASFYEESKITARLFGIDDEQIPDTVADFEEYVHTVLSGDELGFAEDGLRVVDSIMDPPLPAGLRQLAGSGRIFTEGMLPAALREKLGYCWSPRRQRNLERAQTFSQRTLPLLPARVRYFPHYFNRDANLEEQIDSPQRHGDHRE